MKKNFLIIIFTVLISVFGFAQDYSGYSKCAEQDSLALVAFYWATGGPNWTSNITENFSTDFLSDDVYTYYTDDYPNAGLGRWLDGPVKDWFGVTLAKKQIGSTTDSAWRVIHLHPTLSRRSAGENNLIGYVPKEVGLLTALEWFKANGNDGMKNTEVPDELYHSTIQALDFEGVFFSGVLSGALRNCTNLKYPNFRDNYFDSIPLIDFLDEPSASLWMYRNQISWAAMEPTVAYMIEKGYKYEARDQHDVGRASEIVVTPGSSVTLTCNEAGAKGTCTWIKKGLDTYKTGTTYTIDNISASDTGNYTVVVANEYIRVNDGNADYVKTYTKPIHVTFEPSTPYVKKAYTDYSGNTLLIEFTKPMAEPTASQASEFNIVQNGTSITATSLKRTGRLNNILELSLEESIINNTAVSVSYTMGTIKDINGGELKSIKDNIVSNLVREAINLVNAVTSTDGSKIILEFDKYIDLNTFMPSDFAITGSKTYSIDEIVLVAGSIDSDISNKIAVTTTDGMSKDDDLKISYTRGSLTALYGAALQSFSDISVENIITENKLAFKLKVYDGTESIDEVVVLGDMKSKAFALYDDGTNGDELANDNVWTIDLGLTDGDYDWEVYSRTTSLVYDTTKTVDPVSGEIKIILTPVESYADSLISGESNLSLSVAFATNSVTGDSEYKFRTNMVTFILDMSAYIANNPNIDIEPYLMGIDVDWTNGIAMNQVSNTTGKFITTVKGYAYGDEITYNFKNGDIWENSSAESRKYTIFGIDTVEVEFGIYNKIYESSTNMPLVVYPNPVESEILWFNTNKATEVSICNLKGQNVITLKSPSAPINVSHLKMGVYLIRIKDSSGKFYQGKFIKK